MNSARAPASVATRSTGAWAGGTASVSSSAVTARLDLDQLEFGHRPEGVDGQLLGDPVAGVTENSATSASAATGVG